MDKHVEYLRRLFASTTEFEDGVSDVLTYCRTLSPAASWQRADELDLAAESRSFGAWIERTAPELPVAVSIRAYYFGISGDATLLHMDGASEFDSTDDSCDWACSVAYRSDEDWTDSEALRLFSRISAEVDGSVPILLYVLCLGYIGLLIREHVPNRLWKITGAQAPVAVGFDDGDAYLVLQPGC